jgi:hypothetical protein
MKFGMPIGSWKRKEDYDPTRESSDSVLEAVGEDEASSVARKRLNAIRRGTWAPIAGAQGRRIPGKEDFTQNDET